MYHCSVLPIVIDIWNNLPLEIVSATTTAVFRKKLDTVNFTTYMLDKY